MATADSGGVAALHELIQNVVRRTLFPQLCVPEVSVVQTAPLTNRHPTAKGRRANIARCRTLRQEIASFEAKFSTSKGHSPKGSERFPIQHVYTEYRNLKVCIRDDAATHIQAVFRGHRHRVSMRSKDMRRASKSAAPSSASASAPSLSGSAALVTLRDEKASLKRQLRTFDVSFQTTHGRAPSKAEKEHLRPQYTRYHELKDIITDLESQESRRPLSLSFNSGHTATPASIEAPNAALADDDARSRRSDSISSVAGIDGPDGGDVEDEDTRPGSALSNSSGAGGSASRGAAAAGVSASTGLAGSAGAALRAEKKKLQAFLRDYEKSFLERWGRPVKLVKDIAPVLDKYQRYKQLKQAVGGAAPGKA